LSSTGPSHDARSVPVRVASDGQRSRRRRYRRRTTPTARLIPILQGLTDELRFSCRRLLITQEDLATVPSLQATVNQEVPFMVDVATSTDPIIIRVPNIGNQPLYFQLNAKDIVALVIPPRNLDEHRRLINARQLVDLTHENIEACLD
jgi:hypothetical protein